MFIRKRILKLKNGKKSIRYQAVESFRDGKRVRQRVMTLREHADPNKTLYEDLRILKRINRGLERPLTEYREFTWTVKWGPRILLLPVEEARKRRIRLMKSHEKWIARVSRLESIVSKYNARNADKIDTTLLKIREKKREKEAENNLKNIQKVIKKISN